MSGSMASWLLPLFEAAEPQAQSSSQSECRGGPVSGPSLGENFCASAIPGLDSRGPGSILRSLFSIASGFILHKTLTNRITHYIFIVWGIPALLALSLWGTREQAGGPSSKLLREAAVLCAALERLWKLFGFGAGPISIILYPVGVDCSFFLFRFMTYSSMDRY